MRALPIVAAGISVALTGTVVGLTAVAGERQQSFAQHAAALEQRWNAETAAGEPAASIESLRKELHGSPYSTAPSWSPEWWVGTGQAVLDTLETRTARAWTEALAASRGQAASVLTGWEQMAAELSPYVPPAAISAQRAWKGELTAAVTPVAVAWLAKAWTAEITTVRNESLLRQLNAEVASYGGVNGLLSQADKAVGKAHRDNLSPGHVPALATTLRTQMAAHADATTTLRALVAAVGALHALLGLNGHVAAGLPPTMYSVDQAAAEGVPNASNFLAQYSAVAAAFRAARETSQLSAVAARIVALQTAVASALSADQCGHDVPSGKVITLNLTLQEAIFYNDGCVVRASPITTGRPFLRTPTGHFHVFFKTSPFTMVSPWPPGSPFWYPTGTVNWVMEFDTGGYFIHDASWEPASAYGPGSEDTSIASHGCVHLPTPVMRWAYSWTPIDTPVIITQ